LYEPCFRTPSRRAFTRSAALTLAAAVAGAALILVASLRRAEDTRDGIYLVNTERMPDGPFCCMMPKFGNDDYSSGPDECACAPVFAVSNATGPYNYCAQSDENCADCGYTWCPGRKHVDDIEPTTTEGDDVSLVGGGGGGGGGGGDLEYHGPLPHVKLPIVKLPPLAVTSTVTTGGAAPASEPTAPTVTVALPTPVAPEGPPAPTEEPATPASSGPAAEPAPGPTPGAANSTEETNTPP
jgi:hypothetical protein